MNLPPKVRTDYHHLCHDQDIFQVVSRWLKPSVWLMVGFFGGILCNRTFFHTTENPLHYTELTPSYTVQMSSITTEAFTPALKG